MPRAAETILSALVDYFAQNCASGLRETRLVLLDRSAVEVFVSLWKARLEQPKEQSGQRQEPGG